MAGRTGSIRFRTTQLAISNVPRESDKVHGMAIRFARLVTAVACLSACTESTSLPDDAQSRCSGDSECPTGLFCNVATRLCQEPGASAEDVPALRVAFVNPQDGAEEIPTNTTVVIAFSANVDVAGLSDAVSLRPLPGVNLTECATAPNAGEPVSLSRSNDGLENVFQFALASDARLAGNTVYRLRVAAGLEAPVGLPVRAHHSVPARCIAGVQI